MLAPLLFALVVLGSVQQPTGEVRGVVRSDGTGGPLEFAVVEMVGGEFRAAVSDSAGEYVLPRVAPGRRVLRARHAYHTLLEVEVLVPADGVVVLDLTLALQPVSLPAVTARAEPRPAVGDTARLPFTELGATAVRALEATPGLAEMGLTEATTGLAGREPVDPTDVLFVRGAAADLKLILLDGAPVHTPFHLGGLISAFEPELLNSAKLHLGGASAKHDGGLSYVLNLETRAGRPEALRVVGAADLLSNRGVVEGPLPRGGAFLVGARQVHGGGAEQWIGYRFPYGYADGTVRLDVPVWRDDVIAVTGFWNQESVRLDSLARGGEASWGNRAGSIRYMGMLGAADVELTAAYGKYGASLPLGGPRPLTADGRSRRARLALDMGAGDERARLEFGGSYTRLWLDYSAWPAGGERDSLLLESRVEADVAGIYSDLVWQVGSRLLLRGGLRADVFSLEPNVMLAPRLQALWVLTDRAALSLAGGQFRQYVRSGALLPTGTPSPDAPRVSPLSVAQASHLVLALDQDLGDGLRLGLDGFYKTFTGLPGALEDERVESSGVDLWLRRGNGRIRGWVGYSLGWNWATEGGRTQHFSGRQLLSAGIGGGLGGEGRFNIRIGYGAGLPYATVPDAELPSPLPVVAGRVALEAAERDPEPIFTTVPREPYFRLDLDVGRTWRPHWRGHAMEFTPYFKLLNALDRQDALFYHFDGGERTKPQALGAIPMLPVVGLEWRF
jgi:hypothetical protein